MSSHKSSKARKLLEFSIEDYAYCKFCMENHLGAIRDHMLDGLEDGFYWEPISIGRTEPGAFEPQREENRRSDLTNKERNFCNLDQVARTKIIDTLTRYLTEQMKTARLPNICGKP